MLVAGCSLLDKNRVGGQSEKGHNNYKCCDKNCKYFKSMPTTKYLDKSCNQQWFVCAQCGLKLKDHYTYNHSFKPIKLNYCGDNEMSPFDPTPRDVPGYNPFSFKFFPVDDRGLGFKECKGKICGGRFAPHND